MPWRVIKRLRWHLTSSNPLLWQRFEFHIDFCLKGTLRAHLNKEHFGNRRWHSVNAYTSESLILIWIVILLSCYWEQGSPFCLVSPGKGSALRDNNRGEFAGPQRATGVALLVVVSAVSWKMVWNWEDPSELWEGKLHPSQLLTNGKRKHQSDKPGAEVSGCGFKDVAHPAESCPGVTGCPCSLVQGGFGHGWV